MIISDRHRFAFVHIPKNAGTTVRNALEVIDDYHGVFGRKANHPEMGEVNLAHIELKDLASHYHGVFEKLSEYNSCAVVRDPEERFISSIFQRLREHIGIDQSIMTDARVREEIDAVASFLKSADRDRRMPYEYVHFTPQIHYVDLEGKRIIKNLFSMSSFSEAASFVEKITGVKIDAGQRSNSSAAIKYEILRPIVRVLKKPYNHLPGEWRESFRNKLIERGLLANQTQSSLSMLNEVRPFLTDFYARDYQLYRDVMA